VLSVRPWFLVESFPRRQRSMVPMSLGAKLPRCPCPMAPMSLGANVPRCLLTLVSMSLEAKLPSYPCSSPRWCIGSWRPFIPCFLTMLVYWSPALLKPGLQRAQETGYCSFMGTLVRWCLVPLRPVQFVGLITWRARFHASPRSSYCVDLVGLEAMALRLHGFYFPRH
jgi:hypothetical protein